MENNQKKITMKVKDHNEGITEHDIVAEGVENIPEDKLAHITIGNAYTFSLDTGNCQNCDKKMGNFDRTRIAKAEIRVTLPCNIDNIDVAIIRGSALCKKVLKINAEYTLKKYKNNIGVDDNLQLLKGMLKDGLSKINERDFESVVDASGGV